VEYDAAAASVALTTVLSFVTIFEFSFQMVRIS
jgi:hypothetical protein